MLHFKHFHIFWKLENNLSWIFHRLNLFSLARSTWQPVSRKRRSIGGGGRTCGRNPVRGRDGVAARVRLTRATRCWLGECYGRAEGDKGGEAHIHTKKLTDAYHDNGKQWRGFADDEVGVTVKLHVGNDLWTFGEARQWLRDEDRDEGKLFELPSGRRNKRRRRSARQSSTMAERGRRWARVRTWRLRP